MRKIIFLAVCVAAVPLLFKSESQSNEILDRRGPQVSIQNTVADNSAATIYKSDASEIASPAFIIGGGKAISDELVYPPELMGSGHEANLRMQFVVNTDGRPSNVSMLNIYGNFPRENGVEVKQFSDAAVQAIEKLEFEAARLESGESVKVRMIMVVKFHGMEGAMKRLNSGVVEDGGNPGGDGC